jgi:hypothetical protein
MARRIVQECDLTKQEYDPAETVTLIIKKNGKKQGRTYELSPEAAAKLEQQLVSGNKLPNEWGFGSGTRSSESVIKADSVPRKLADLDSDEQFVAEKKRSLAAEGVDIAPREKTNDQPTILPEMAVDGSACMHLNKSPIQTTMHDGKRVIYRTCRDCRKRINEKTKDEKAAFFGAKAPPDTREGHSSIVQRKNE